MNGEFRLSTTQIKSEIDQWAQSLTIDQLNRSRFNTVNDWQTSLPTLAADLQTLGITDFVHRVVVFNIKNQNIFSETEPVHVDGGPNRDEYVFTAFIPLLSTHIAKIEFYNTEAEPEWAGGELKSLTWQIEDCELSSTVDITTEPFLFDPRTPHRYFNDNEDGSGPCLIIRFSQDITV